MSPSFFRCACGGATSQHWVFFPGLLNFEVSPVKSRNQNTDFLRELKSKNLRSEHKSTREKH